jgi:iron complex outermembrane recepter protein
MNAIHPHHRILPACALVRAAVALAGIVLLLFSAAATLSAQAGATGSLRGKVYNSGTGNYLEGATVTVVGTGQIQLTDRLGQYAFTSVPAGYLTLRVSYPGLPDSTMSAMVAAGERTVVEDVAVGAAAETIVLADFVVQGEREGQAKAIVMERDAPNVVTVVATDAYGNVGSNSVGNLLQYLPGLTTEGFDGEAFNVSVRGMDPEYGSVTTDGARLASSTQGGGLSRSTFVLDIGLVNFSEIEVIKAPTPDKAADSTGGVINLRTRSVFATKAPRSGRLSVGLSTTLKEGMRFEQPHPSFTLNYRQILGGSDGKFGFTFNASSNTRYIPRDQTNIDYESTFNPINPDTPYINQVAKQFGHQEVTRRSIGGRLEYRPGEMSLFSVGVTYNYHHRFSDSNNRNWSSNGNAIGTPALPSTFATGGLYTGPVGIAAGYTADEVFWPKGQVSYSSQIYTTNTEQLALRFAGEHSLGDWKIDYDANYSDYDKKQRRTGDWPGGFGGNTSLAIRNVGLRVTGLKNSHYYAVEHVGGRDPDDLANYQSFTFNDWNANWAESSVASSSVSATRTLHWAAPTILKAGLNYRRQEQNQLPTRWDRYTYIGPRAALTPERIGGFSPLAGDIPRNPLQGGMPLFFPSIIDASAIRADVQQNPQDWSVAVPQAGGQRDDGFTEGISSAYVSATLRLFEKRLTLLGGVRVERTDVEARNGLASNPFSGEPTYTQKKDYTDSFPSLHATWRHVSGLQLRASYSASIGRPNPNSIIPRTTVMPFDDEDGDTGVGGRINAVNTGLKPRYVDNFDLELEYYFPQGGRISAGTFRKNMSNFIETNTLTLGPGNEFGDEYIGWELRTQKNAGKGRVEGVEFEYQSPSLGRFVGFLHGFTVFANYTHLKAIGQMSDGGSRSLTGFKPRTGNAGIAYSRAGTSIRMRANFRGEYLRFASSNPADERWEYDQTKVDLNLERKLMKNLSAYVDVINVFNAKGRRFRGNPDDGRRRHWADNNGPELYAGVNLIF